MTFRNAAARHATFWVPGGAFLALVAAGGALPGAAAKPPVKKATIGGSQVFKTQCAPCHGANGEGGPGYPRPLVGDRSVGQLAAYVAGAMPPGEKHASPAEAKAVASFMHDAFYSPLAQERNRPARVELSRLTVRQYRNAVADLVGAFRPAPPPAPAERGLSAEYFKSRRFRKEDRAVERTDPELRFNFDRQAPGAGFDPHEFSARWQGSVVAPDTGVYEFVLKTDQAARLWVNDNDKPLVDAWVRSGSDTEFRGSLFLVGGRAYPVRVEFSKSTQGVEKKKEAGTLPDKASITLAWKRPKQAEEPVPRQNLLPVQVPESFASSTPFPPDDRSMGYERGNSVSKEWDEAATSGALEAGDYVLAHLKELAGAGIEDPEKLKSFCRRFVERALRRPLDAEAERLYIAKQFEAAPDPETAVKRVVLLALLSPRFLYREIGSADGGDPYSVASRLSFALWDSIPDDALLQAAAENKLSTREQVATQAERMVADPRAWSKQREFFLQWLKVDQHPDLHKDGKRFPGFSPEVATDLRTSLELTLERVVRGEKSDFRELMLTPEYPLNGRLAKLYGAPLEPDARTFRPVKLDPKERAGVLTHPYVLASFAYTSASSPIHRGVLLTRSVMGRTLSQPPEAFTPLDSALHPKLTTRQRVEMQTSPKACQSCHAMINPLGFTLERFDAIGKLRAAENGKPVDARGRYEPKQGGPVAFNGARDLARYVATSDEAHAAFVEKLFQFHVKQPIRAWGPRALPALQKEFAAGDYSIRRLVAEIATTAALPQATGSQKTATREGKTDKI